MKEAFQSRAVSKLYWAIVRGVPAWDSITIDAALGPAAGSAVNLRRGADPGGDPAVTKVRLLARLPAHALVACKPVTGRTHQIRAHLEHAGFPLLGDKLYGQPDDIFLEQLRVGITDRVRAAIGFPRHALHARAIAFPHPVSGQVLKVTAPLPPDLQAIVDGATPRWDATPEEPTS
jgi:23S rRNA pseudouridine1911/1915/1917 synthase